MTDGEADFLGLPEYLTPEEEAAEEKAAVEKLEERRLFLYRLMSDPDFRTWLWEQLQAFGAFEHRFMASPTGFPDRAATQFQSGLKAAGWALWEQFDNAVPELASQMRREGLGIEPLKIVPPPKRPRRGRRVIIEPEDEG